MASTLPYLLVLLSVSVTHCAYNSTVVCHFSPPDGVRHKVGEKGDVNFTCTNKMYSLGKTIVIIILDPSSQEGDSLSLCVQEDNVCNMTEQAIMLNMTSREVTYSLQVTANRFGIRCIKETSVYQRGPRLYPSSMSDEDT